MLLKTVQLTARNFRVVNQLLKVESHAVVSIKNYSRFQPRSYKSIVNEDEVFDFNDLPTPTPRTVKEAKPKLPKSKPKDTKECNEELGKQLYTKLYESDKKLSSLMMAMRSKKQRKKNEQIVLEGIRLIEEALKAGVELETLLFTRYEDIAHLPIPNTNTKLFKTPYRSLQVWSTLTTSPGVMGIFKKPKPIKESANSFPITIICDNIRDPGNMGAILRAAAGVGCEKVILTKGCVDFWDPKVMRSATGAHFRVPIHGSLDWNAIRPLLSEDAHVYIADNNANIYKTSDNENVEFEAEEEEEEDEEERNEREKKKEKSKKEIIYADKKLNKKMSHYRSNSINFVAKYNNLPIVPYFAVDYSTNPVILIIGGETEGLSSEAFQLIESKSGVRVNIPLDNDVDSLNAGMALGIVAFEIKRQFLSVKTKLMQQAQ